MKQWICSLILVLAASVPALAAASGPARVIDGDTLQLGSVHIRIASIDAPEIRQDCTDSSGAEYACGWSAKTALADIINNSKVTCRRVGWDRYRRQIAVCRTHTVPDLGAEMVRRGWAVDYRKYDKNCRYCGIEADSKRAGNGMWGGKFEMPWQWRGDHGK
jgi:endonuclease YncB( thermonuclease family)